MYSYIISVKLHDEVEALSNEKSKTEVRGAEGLIYDLWSIFFATMIPQLIVTRLFKVNWGQ